MNGLIFVKLSVVVEQPAQKIAGRGKVKRVRHDGKRAGGRSAGKVRDMNAASKAHGAAEPIIAVLKFRRDAAAGGDACDLDLVPPRAAA